MKRNYHDRKTRLLSFGGVLCFVMICFNLFSANCLFCECKPASAVITYSADQKDTSGAPIVSCFKRMYYFYVLNSDGSKGSPFLNGSARIVYPPFIGPYACAGGSNQQTTNKMWRQELWNNFCPCLVVYTPKRNTQVEWVAPPYQPLTQSQIEDEDCREGPDFIYVCSGGGGSGGEQ
jgi:hypothetical protein